MFYLYKQEWFTDMSNNFSVRNYYICNYVWIEYYCDIYLVTIIDIKNDTHTNSQNFCFCYQEFCERLCCVFTCENSWYQELPLLLVEIPLLISRIIILTGKNWIADMKKSVCQTKQK